MKNEILLRIRRRREYKGYSQEYMAHCISITQSAYYKLENGKVPMKVEQLIKIFEVLEMGLLIKEEPLSAKLSFAINR